MKLLWSRLLLVSTYTCTFGHSIQTIILSLLLLISQATLILLQKHKQKCWREEGMEITVQ